MATDTEISSSATRLGGAFHKLWAAAAVSNLGDGVWLIAAPLLAATLTRDPLLIAGMSFTQRIPWMIFPLFSGALADRVDRRKAMIAVTLVRASLAGLLGLSVIGGWATLPLLYVVFFLVTTGETLFDTSATAVLPAVVSRKHLTKANARLSGTISVTNLFIGRPLGGFLFARVASLPFMVGAFGLVLAAGILSTLQGSFTAEQREGTQRRSMRSEIAEGVRWLLRHRLLRTTAVTLGVLNFVYVAQVSIMVLYVEELLGLGPSGYGMLLSVTGMGAIVGSLFAERVLRFTGEARYLLLAVVIEGFVPAVLALTESPIVAGMAMFLFGVHATTWGAILMSLRQELTPDALRGRVQSVHALIENGTQAPGALAGGMLAAWVGLTAPFWFSTIVALLLLPLVWPVYTEQTLAKARETASERG